MNQKAQEELEHIAFILSANKPVKEKYFQIKSLEMNLLEYLVCKETFSQPSRYKLTNAAKFINSYFFTQNVWYDFDKYEVLAAFTLATLKEILNSDGKSLEEIREFRVYEKYYSDIHQTLGAV